MEFKFECPACGQHLSATPAQIGVTAPCPNCKAAVTIPSPSPHPQSQPPQPIRQSPPVKASIKRKSSLAGVGCLLQGLGAVCLVLAVATIKTAIVPVLSLEYLVCGFCSTVAGKLHGLSAHCAAASFRTGALVFVRTVMQVFDDPHGMMLARVPGPTALFKCNCSDGKFRGISSRSFLKAKNSSCFAKR